MIVDTSIRCTSPREAEDALESASTRPRIDAAAPGFIFEQRTRGDVTGSVSRLRIGGPATITVDIDRVVGIGHLRSGTYRAESNGDPIDPSGPFVLRPGQATSWSDTVDLSLINLDVDELVRHAAVQGSASVHRLRFDRVDAVSAETRRNWARTVAHATDVFADIDLLHNDLIRQSVVHLLYSAALTAFVLPSDRTSDVDTDHPAAIRRALRFIDDHAADPITLTDIAEASRLSIRGLEASFRRNLDTTPLARLRTVRLSYAHADLIAADPADATVADIARRWGFPHASRFAGYYRTAYDRLPRETLGG